MNHPLPLPSQPATATLTHRRTRGLRRGAVLVAGLGIMALLGPAATASPLNQVASVAAEDPPVTFGLTPTQKANTPYRPNFVVDLPPGGEVKDSFRVLNSGSRKQTFTLFAGDAFNAVTGAIDLLPTGDESKDIGSWITLDKTELELDGGQTTNVGFTLKVPAGATPGDHTAAIVASLKSTGPAGGPAVTVDNRIGTRVLLRVAGPLDPKMTITDLKTSFDGPLNPLGRGTIDISYRVTNSGNVRMGADQSIKFSSPVGFPSKKFTPPAVQELLPGNSVVQTFKVSGVWPTWRTSTAVTVTPSPVRVGDSFDAGVTVRAKTSTWTMPWAFLALVVLVLALGWYLRRRREQLRTADQQRLQSMLDARLGESAEGPVASGDLNR